MIMDKEIILTQGSPEQAELAAPLIYETEPHLFEYLFGKDYEGVLKYLGAEWRQDESEFSYSHCTAAVKGEDLLGIEIGFGKDKRIEAQANTGKAGLAHLKPEVIDHLRIAARYLPYLLPPIPRKAYYVNNLASSPRARGTGVGAMLLLNAFDRAREQGFREVHLDVYKENPAVGFYHHMGMEIISEVRVLPAEEHGVGNHFRMVKKLS